MMGKTQQKTFLTLKQVENIFFLLQKFLFCKNFYNLCRNTGRACVHCTLYKLVFSTFLKFLGKLQEKLFPFSSCCFYVEL